MPRRIFVKIFFGSAVLIVIFSAAVYFFAKPILLSIAQKELRKIFKESSIQGVKITQNFIGFQGVEIKEPGSFYFKIKEIRAYYNLKALLEKKIDKVEALEADLDYSKGDIKIKGRVSAQLDVPNKIVDYVKLNVSSLDTGLFQAEGISLDLAQGQDTGEFYIKGVKYNKLKLADIMGKGELKGRILIINPLVVSFLGGNIKGEFSVSLDQDMAYNLRLDTQSLEIKRFVDDMEFNERFDMTGRLGGTFYLSGKGQSIKDIKGDFDTAIHGGVLIIKDKTLLENVAKQSNQPLDKLVESFRNYNYNNGIIKLSMENGNIVLDMKLDGNSGKRSLTIVLHNFK